MANEVNVTCNVSVTKNGLTATGNYSALLTMSGTIIASGNQLIGTSSEQLVFTNMTDIGGIWFKNIDATNFVSIDTVTPAVAAAAPITLLAGESCFVRTRREAWYAIADTAEINLEFVAFSL